MDKYPPTKQRPELLKLVEALGCRSVALRRDENGDWRIKGRFGDIHAVPEGFQIYFRGANEFEEPTTSKGWTYAQEAMSFAKVMQDGDMEGVLLLDRLPTSKEAMIIRNKLRIAKRAEYSEEVLARKREGMLKVKAQIGQKPTSEAL
jgi:hypothetical protein